MSMTFEETAKVFAKVQLTDNREASELALLEFHDIIGEILNYDEAIAAVREFRRTRPGEYLEAGHLIAIAGRSEQPSPYRNINDALQAAALALEQGATPE